MVSRCRSLSDRLPGCQFLGLVTSDENTYFLDTFKFLGVTEEERSGYAMEPVARDFVAIMREAAATGSLSCCLAVLVVCEWSYLEWGTAVQRDTKVKDSPHFQGWIDLHSGKYFESVVAYLKGLLDKEAGSCGEEELGKAREFFSRTVHLEENFFDMAMNC